MAQHKASPTCPALAVVHSSQLQGQNLHGMVQSWANLASPIPVARGSQLQGLDLHGVAWG